MLALLALVFVIAELYVVVQVAGAVGVLDTIGLLVLVSLVGGWLAKRQGLHVLRRLQGTVAAGKVPSGEIVDGFLVLAAGFLLLLPGFLSAALGVVLLLPPVRAVARHRVLRRIRSGNGFVGVVPGRGGRPRGEGEVWDVDGWEDPPAGSAPPQLGP